MRIFLTGATGLIGRHLCQQLVGQHHITALIRNIDLAKSILPAQVELVSQLVHFAHFDEFDAVINLAGEPIFSQAWHADRKQILQQSRVQLTQQLVHLINQSQHIPSVFISASATGYYGDRGNAVLNEQSAVGKGFTADLCTQWEYAASQAQTRTCLLRTGMVLSKQQGAFAKMLKLYSYGLGGQLSNGEQYWSWISLQDMLSAIIFLLENPHCVGVFNLTSPHPLPNKMFNQQLGKWLKRPHFTTVPRFILNALLGERCSLLLDSQNVLPDKLIRAGFTFQYPYFQDFLEKHAL